MTRQRIAWLPLDYKKMKACGAMPEEAFEKPLPKKKLNGFRSMQEKDVEAVTRLLNSYNSQFRVHTLFDSEEVSYWFLTRPDITYSYVVETGSKIVGFVNYHSLFQVSQNDQYTRADLTYYAVDGVSHVDLIGDAILQAKEDGHSLFHAYNTGNNIDFLKEFCFLSHDGSIVYSYSWNWLCPEMSPRDVAVSFY